MMTDRFIEDWIKVHPSPPPHSGPAAFYLIPFFITRLSSSMINMIMIRWPVVPTSMDIRKNVQVIILASKPHTAYLPKYKYMCVCLALHASSPAVAFAFATTAYLVELQVIMVSTFNAPVVRHVCFWY